MQLIKPDININFIGFRKVAFAISVAMILISIISLVIHGGPKQGIDFVGGAEMRIKFESQVSIEALKAGLAAIELGNASVQQYDRPGANTYRILIDSNVAADDAISTKMQGAIEAATGVKLSIESFEMVGPQVGKSLREKALLAMFIALLLITVYISGRFELKWMVSIVIAAVLALAVYLFKSVGFNIPWLMVGALIVAIALFWFLELKYAMGAIVALIHDVTITVGLFSIFDKEFTLPIIAALLTIIGYSLNDTIIVYDRIRENLRKYHRNPLTTIINRSVNETLGRTILTSFTTLVVVVTLFVLGGGIIHDFAFALIVGVMVGTYSSIYVASPILLAWQGRAKK